MTTTYTPITLADMQKVLRADQGWTLNTPANSKEYVFEWALPEADHIVIKVWSSILLATGVSRKSGGDAIRCCAVNVAADKGWIKSIRVHRVAGWAANTQARLIEVIAEARKRNLKVAKLDAVTKVPVTAEKQASLVAIVEKLTEAHGNGIKYPKLRFTLDGEKVVIARVGSGKNEGAANVTDGKPYGEGAWYGRIEKDGSLRKGYKTKQEGSPIPAFLAALSEDVVGYTTAHGQKTGNCCFCARDLTTKESVTAGYGPVCAGKWNLPWGHIDADLFGKKEVTKL